MGVVKPPPACATDAELRERIRVLTSLLLEASNRIWASGVLAGSDDMLSFSYEINREVDKYYSVWPCLSKDATDG